jgi:hypothetical protein
LSRNARDYFLVSSSATAAAASAITAAATAASATAAGTSTSTASTAASGPAAFRSGTSFVHIYRPTFHFLTVQSCDCSVGFAFGWHFDKSESSGFAAELVFDEVYGTDLAESLKSLTYVFFRRVM